MIEDEKNKKSADIGVYELKTPEKEGASNFSWSAVSNQSVEKGRRDNKGVDNFMSGKIDFVGKNLQDGQFARENLEGANFSVANLQGVDFSGANLKGADFSGANLTGANLEGANLEGAIFSGAQLIGTNLSKAVLKGVKLTDADITDALLIDIDIDSLGIEELQELAEYLAKYYPHKLNLAKLNLALLDLAKIDLKNVSLRGVDFTGCSFVGVNIMELDLSECVITPEQIAQALGRAPSEEEMKQLLAPKQKKKGAGKGGIDLDGLFNDDGKTFGVTDVTKHKGATIEEIINAGKRVFRHSAGKPQPKNQESLEKAREEQQKEAKSDREELRQKIEENKRKELERRKEQHREAVNETKQKPKERERSSTERIKQIKDRSRD